ncbi:uncharacterized protein LOC108094503 [Drosophila ficusphila]|uniref:uncharacterized protein LOC108094503 n=1 Tax=Drosophila ficusphila TaxID=30025 RepID=UPI001C8A0479|nr:uncharacterized protein LOC108094503 [Drosophila ficusphila]
MKFWFWISLFLIFRPMRTEERNFRVVIEQVNISNVDTNVYRNLSCELHQINNRSYLDSSHIFKYTIRDLSVHAVLDFWKLNSKTKMKLYDVQFDACNFLENASKNRLFNVYGQSLKKHANMKFKCPFLANVSYEVHNMTMDEQDFPSFVPLGKFRSLIEYLTNQKLISRFIATGKIMPYATDPFKVLQ